MNEILTINYESEKGRSAAPFAKACLRHLSLLRSYFAHRVALISSV